MKKSVCFTCETISCETRKETMRSTRERHEFHTWQGDTWHVTRWHSSCKARYPRLPFIRQTWILTITIRFMPYLAASLERYIGVQLKFALPDDFSIVSFNAPKLALIVASMHAGPVSRISHYILFLFSKFTTIGLEKDQIYRLDYSFINLIPIWSICDPHGDPRVTHKGSTNDPHNLWSTCDPHVIHMWSTCDPHVIHVWSTCGPHVIHMWSTRDLHLIHRIPMWSTCDPHVIHMWSTCDQHVIHMWSTCDPHVIHRIPMWNTCVNIQMNQIQDNNGV